MEMILDILFSVHSAKLSFVLNGCETARTRTFISSQFSNPIFQFRFYFVNLDFLK